MKAVILEDLGKVSYREVKPTDVYMPTKEEMVFHGMNITALSVDREPEENEIVVEAVCVAMCTHEISVYKGDLTCPKMPMVPGHEAVHKVLKVGKNVKHLKAGDYCACCWYHGQWSKRLVGPAEFAYKLPDNIDDPANWIIEPAASIVNAASYMNIKPADRVLLVGAGFMGLLMIQLIKGYPFSQFVVCDVKESSRELAKKCGAKVVCKPEEVEGEFDKVIECSGSQPGLDLAISHSGMAAEVYLFGWHRQPRTVDFKTQHLKGTVLVNTSPAIDDGREYSRYWPKTIKLFEAGIFDMSLLVSHKYTTDQVEKFYTDSVKREEGFVKSVMYLDK